MLPAEGTVSRVSLIASPTLHRTITWVNAFWVASGSPALIRFTIGALAATVGNAAWAVWTLSITFGFIQCFTYAEIAGLYPDKSGGASIYGAMAWVGYGKFLAPISVWCNWIAWSPVLALGTGLASGYILSILFAPDSAVNTWSLLLVDLSAIRTGLTLRVNSNTLLAGFLMLWMGADLWGRGTLLSGLALTSAIIPLFWWRHYVVDGGRFPHAADHALSVVNAANSQSESANRAGLLPYLALLLAGIVIAAGRAVARL